MMLDYTPAIVRTSAVLTNSYVAGTVIEENTRSNQLALYIFFTKGSLTSLEIKVEFSHDGVTYVQETFAAQSAGTETDTLGEHTFTATGNYRLEIPIKDKYIKVSAKGTGTVTDSLCSITALLGVI